MPIRFVKLVHLDGSVRTKADDGCDKQGEPNQQRQHLIAMLMKRTAMPALNEDGTRRANSDGPDVDERGFLIDGDGKQVKVNTFRLAEAPKPFPFGEYPEKDRGLIRGVDGFDDRSPMRDSDGAWNTGTTKWKAHSVLWQKMLKKRAAESQAVVDQARRLDAGEALENLLISSIQQGKATKQAKAVP